MKKYILLSFCALTSLSAGAASLSSEKSTATASLAVAAEKVLSVNVEALENIRPGAAIGTPLFKIQAQGTGLDGQLGLTDEIRKSQGRTGWWAYTPTGNAALMVTFGDGCTTGASGLDNSLGYSVKTCEAKNGTATYEATATLATGNVVPGTYTLTVGAYDFQA